MRKLSVDWYVWGQWPGIPWFHACYLYGLALEMRRRCGIELSHVAADYTHGTQTIYLSKSEWEEAGKQYLDRILSSPPVLAKHLERIERAADRLFAFNQTLPRLKLDTLPDGSLRHWVRTFHQREHELWCAGMVPNLLELNQSYLSTYLHDQLERTAGTALKISDWQTLIGPTTLSWAQKEERAWLTLVMMFENNRALKAALGRSDEDVTKAREVLRRFPVVDRSIRRHWRRYQWVRYGWVGPATSLEYFIDVFVRMLRQGDARVLLQKFLQEHTTLIYHQRRLERTIVESPKMRLLLRLLRRLLADKALRVDAATQGYWAIESAWSEFTRRGEFSKNQAMMIYPGWLEATHSRRMINADVLNAAWKYSTLIKRGARMDFCYGSQARRVMAPIVASLPNTEATDTVTGECGYPGKVQGVVRIIRTSEEMKAFGRGEILVANATDPSYLPVMKIARAFVTDLGGLTAHAAIVARELKIPCVVGTKIATQVFHDGDRVEVDASAGVVRKIN